MPWQYVEDILFEKYPHFHGQLSTNAPSVYAKAFAFEHWYGGGDLESIRDLHFELATRLNEVLRERDRSSAKDVDAILQDISYFTKQQSEEAGDRSLWNLPYPERQALLRQWEAEVDTERFAAKLTGLHFEYKDLVSAANDLSHQRDIKIMGDSNVIGMTTTGCAARWKQLASVGIEITLCEEAAEVMEAHTLCSLLPTVQHAIMIGDPLQLRPETDQQMLTLETQIGMDYRLDESLLERLMLPKDPSSSAVASTHLNIQRRMHPTIANIARIFYPYLRDHKSTLDNPPTVGLVHRMYWWDHRIPELEADDLKSHVNLYEVEMVVGLVTYLLRGGAYDQGDIAVLTPYAGQLSKLNEQLSTTCNIWLSEKDRQLLIDEEVLGLVPEGRLAKDEVPMADMLRIATVDNFQGEEAKIVVLSTVRSGGSAGFLKSINRINVACSRAREGFYIIGDTQTLSKVPMWRQVISAFDGNIGASLLTCCSTHPEHCHAVQQPSDFQMVPICAAVCGQRLECGHDCQQMCHPPRLHDRIACQEACQEVFPCGHPCQKLCYQDCGSCDSSRGDFILPCGHQGTSLCSGQVSKCKVVVSQKLLDCGHSLTVICGDDSTQKDFCSAQCPSILSCGHPCTAQCGTCQQNQSHKICPFRCGQQKLCGHVCKLDCHHGSPCPNSCSEPCADSCEHGPCPGRCSDTCEPCIKLSKPRCEHENSANVLCCLPSTTLPCCVPCPKGEPFAPNGFCEYCH